MNGPEDDSANRVREPDIATQIMSAMVRMPPEPHKDAPKPKTAKGEAQRRRRERERPQTTRESPRSNLT
jgi:hypothetical protein